MKRLRQFWRGLGGRGRIVVIIAVLLILGGIGWSVSHQRSLTSAEHTISSNIDPQTGQAIPATVSPTPSLVATPEATLTPTPAPTPTNENFTGHYYTNMGHLDMTQSGSRVTGTYLTIANGSSGTLEGTVNLNVLTGTWTVASSSGPVSFTKTGRTIFGSYSGDYTWCGAMQDSKFPRGCDFNRSWKVKVGPLNNQCDMVIVRINDSFDGTYCGNGTVSGEANIRDGQRTLDGFWKRNGATGSIHFILPPVGAAQHTQNSFTGNYNTTFQWCGGETIGLQPSPCFAK